MHDLARTLGFLDLAAGIFLAVFPNASRETIRARGELARLSDGALRLLGIWMLVTGWALIWVTAGGQVRSMFSEAFAPARRSAA